MMFSKRSTLAIGTLMLFGAATVTSALAAQRTQTYVYDQQVTDDNDHVKCKHQPCSPDGVWQATTLSLKITAQPGMRLANVVLADGNNQPYPQFCQRLSMDVEVSFATAGVKCWSAPVTWTLSGYAEPIIRTYPALRNKKK